MLIERSNRFKFINETSKTPLHLSEFQNKNKNKFLNITHLVVVSFTCLWQKLYNITSFAVP